MGKDSKIQWTNDTWNPWHGCEKVSDGCKYCYMYRDKERYGQDPRVVMKSKSNFKAPLRLTDPTLIFTCSWSDWFIDKADSWRDEAWKIIKDTPQHTYQILTKRPERIKDHLPADWGAGYENVWLGFSAENQEAYDKRFYEFINIPAKVKFLSAEPLLSEILLHGEHDQWDFWDKVLDWVIVGGESGNTTGKYLYRECDPDWIFSLVRQCDDNDIPVFVKQMGTHIAKLWNLKDTHGGDMDEWHKSFAVRQFPDRIYLNENKLITKNQ